MHRFFTSTERSLAKQLLPAKDILSRPEVNATTPRHKGSLGCTTFLEEAEEGEREEAGVEQVEEEEEEDDDDDNDDNDNDDDGGRREGDDTSEGPRLEELNSGK